MIESIMFLIITVLLIAFITYRDYMERLERKQLIRSIMAKNLTEVVQAEVLGKQEPVEEKPSDLVPLESLDAEGFDKMIKNQLKKASSKNT
jgi:hypothetical protein